MGKNLAFNWWELILMAMKCKWERFPYPKHLSKNICDFVFIILFHVFQPQCVPPFLFIITAAQISRSCFVFVHSRSCCETWSWAASLGDWATLCVWGMTVQWTIPLVARRDGAWTWSWLKTEGRSCWITLRSLQTSGIFMKHCFLRDAKWFWLHKKLRKPTSDNYWVVLSNIFYFHPYLGETIQFDPHNFSDGLKPETTNY